MKIVITSFIKLVLLKMEEMKKPWKEFYMRLGSSITGKISLFYYSRLWFVLI